MSKFAVVKAFAATALCAALFALPAWADTKTDCQDKVFGQPQFGVVCTSRDTSQSELKGVGNLMERYSQGYEAGRQQAQDQQTAPAYQEPARATPARTASEIIDLYDSTDAQTKADIEFAVGAMKGGMLTINDYKSDGRLICVPDRLHLEAAQVISMIRSEIKYRPELGKEKMAAVMLEALMSTFPCKSAQ